jgi:orotate phosphoribosyltransferase
MNLFQLGQFKLHSGQVSDFKIQCEALTDADLDCIAFLLSRRVPPFGSVEGVPTGGNALALKMERYIVKGNHRLLVVDDVFTTGRSLSNPTILKL